MNAYSYLIHIPEPCHEDWEAMSPEDKGRFCGSCSKVVIDFSDRTDAEIRDVLLAHRDQKVCGHFKTSQVNRPLTLQVDPGSLPKNMGITRAFAIAAFLVFGSWLFNCTNLQGQTMGDVKVEKTHREPYKMGKPVIKHADAGEKRNAPKSSCSTTTAPAVKYTGPRTMGEPVMIPKPSQDEKEPVVMGLVVLPAKDTAGVITPTVQAGNAPVKDENGFRISPDHGSGEFTISYTLAKKATVTIDVFDLKGKLLRNLVNVSGQYQGQYHIPVALGDLPEGTYEVVMWRNGQRSGKRLVIGR